MRHRKVAQLARALRLRRSHVIGHLHSLWHAALEQQDDGDLSSWSDEFIAECSDYPGDAPQWVRLLQEVGWFDGKLLHDWPDYAGMFLRNRYASGNREKLVAIWAKHGRVYGEPYNQQGTNKGPTSKKPPPTKPNQTNQPTNQQSGVPPGFEQFWEEWPAHFRKKAREKCLAHWGKHKLEAIAPKIISAVQAWKKSDQWAKEDGQFIPGPLPWLNQQTYNAAMPPTNGSKSGHKLPESSSLRVRM